VSRPATYLRPRPTYRPGRIRRTLAYIAIAVLIIVAMIMKLRHDYPMSEAVPTSVCLRSGA